MASLGGADALLVSRGLVARIFHAVLFEITAILLTSVFLIFVMRQGFVSMGVLAIMISAIATTWNGIFNFFFDRIQKRFVFTRTAKVRFLHATLFELGLMVFTVPVAAVYLDISFAASFFLEVGLIALFLPYSVVFNYIYDKIYVWYYKRSEKKR